MERLYGITADLSTVNFRPASVEEEIFQNINTILTTFINSVPLFREFGISPEYIDEPIDLAKAKMSSDIAERIELFEPRVIVEKIDFVENELEGKLTPRIGFRIRSEVS